MELLLCVIVFLSIGKLSLPYLKKSKNPLIINISAHLDGKPYQTHAACAKAAINTLTKNLAGII